MASSHFWHCFAVTDEYGRIHNVESFGLTKQAAYDRAVERYGCQLVQEAERLQKIEGLPWHGRIRESTETVDYIQRLKGGE